MHNLPVESFLLSFAFRSRSATFRSRSWHASGEGNREGVRLEEVLVKGANEDVRSRTSEASRESPDGVDAKADVRARTDEVAFRCEGGRLRVRSLASELGYVVVS